MKKYSLLFLISVVILPIARVNAMGAGTAHDTQKEMSEKTEESKKILEHLFAQQEPSAALVKSARFDKNNGFAIGEIVLIPFQTKENEEYSYAYVSREPHLSADDSGPYGKEWLIRTEFYADDAFAGCVAPVRAIGKLSANDELCND